jgi:cytochrome c oxidase assembly protein subunit 15
MWTYRLSLATAVAAWILLLAGRGMPGGSGLLDETGYRLAEGGVWVLTAGLCVVSLVEGRRLHPAVPPLGALALLLLTGQGRLHSLIATADSPVLLSWAHLCLSMLFLPPVVGIACLSRHVVQQDSPARRDAVPRPSYYLLVLATVLCFVQIAVGGLVRFAGAGLACSDLPLCHGSVLPLGDAPPVILQAVHRLHGLVFAVVTFFALPRLRPHLRRRSDATRRALVVLLPLVVLLQLAVGLLGVWSDLAPLFVTLHLGLGALLLAGLLVLCFRLRAVTEAGAVAGPRPRLGPRLGLSSLSGQTAPQPHGDAA